MNAREMFEEQRYKRNEENEEIIYLQRFGSGYFRITFDLSKEEIAIDTNMENVIESDLLQAIIKQAKELGWLEEEKQETNLERYYDDLLEEEFSDFGVVNGKIESCTFISCKKCEFEGGNCHKNRITWLKSKYKKRKHKFTQFEYDLIDTYRGSNEICKFHNCYQLRRLKEKGYFNDVDKNESIKDILANCEVEG